MRIDENKFKLLLLKWIKWDKELWTALTELQIEILIRRLVRDGKFTEMSNLYKVPVSKMRAIFSAILIRIEKSHGQELANLLRQINTEMEAREMGIAPKDTGFNIGQVWLN